jgi:hypothetical protein
MASLVACSGGGALIAESILYAQEHALIVGGVLVLSIALRLISSRLWAMPLIELFLLVTHPAWTISAINGDCGMLKHYAATAYTGLASVVLAIQIAGWLWPRSKVAMGHNDKLPPDYIETGNPYESPRVR